MQNQFTDLADFVPTRIPVIVSALFMKEMKCFGDSEIFHEIVRNTTQISLCFSDFRVVSQTMLCCISEFQRN